MSLLKKSSRFDLLPGNDDRTNPIGKMEETKGKAFDRGPGSTLQQDSLSEIPNKSLYQDLDGQKGPSFDLGPRPIGEAFQQDLLLEEGNKLDNTPFSVDGTTFDFGKKSSLHAYNPINQLIKTNEIPAFFPPDAYEIYKSKINPQSSFGAGQAGGPGWPAVGATDLSMLGIPILSQGQMFLGPNADLIAEKLESIPKPGTPFQDLNTTPTSIGDAGFFHNIPNPGKGQGKQLDGEDLHVALLTQNYTYNHGNSVESVGPSPGATGNSEYQDLNSTVDSIGDANYFHGIPNPGKGQGKTLNGEDLHVTMLQTAYIYTHGDAVGIVGPSPGPTGNSEYQDLGDGAPGTPYNNVGGNGFFHGVANPGRYNGKQLGGVDLHQALLTNTYQYSHGISVGGYNSVVQVGPSPGATGFSDFADLDGGLPATGKYTNPETGIGF